MKKRMGDLAVEAAMVVFAVLVALAVEEWREERQLQDFAARAEAAVMAEIQANRDELRQTGPTIRRSHERVGEALETGSIDALQGDLEFELPDISSAAWAAASASARSRPISAARVWLSLRSSRTSESRWCPTTGR